MSSALLVPLSCDPVIRIVETPALTHAQQAQLLMRRRRLAISKHEFDGPVLVTQHASPTEVLAFEATYAWILTIREDPDALPGLGLLGAILLIEDEHGRWLWQRRGPACALPGVWTFAASGLIDPHERSAIAAATRECQEELGVPATQLEQIMPLALVFSFDGVSIITKALIAADTLLTLQSSEVAETRWSRDIPATGTENRCALTETAWRRMQPWLANSAAGIQTL